MGHGVRIQRADDCELVTNNVVDKQKFELVKNLEFVEE
jgi:hypothetical protein